MAYMISPRMAELIRNSTGLSIGQIRTMPTEKIQMAVEKKVGHGLDIDLDPGETDLWVEAAMEDYC